MAPTDEQRPSGGRVIRVAVIALLAALHNISQLRTAFKTASDQPRLIVLVSPT